MTAVLRAIGKQPPEFAVDFVEEQLKNGNFRSLQSCYLILDGDNGGENLKAPDMQVIHQAFAGRLSVLLPLAVERQELVDGLVASASHVSREELLKLNPDLGSLATKLFWEQTKVKDTEIEERLVDSAAGETGRTSESRRRQDRRILGESIHQTYLGHKRDLQRILSSVYKQGEQLGSGQFIHRQPISRGRYQAMVGWHDGIRFKILLKILQAVLGNEAAERRVRWKSTISDRFEQVRLCLETLMPKMDVEERQQAKRTIIAIRRDLPDAFFNINLQGSSGQNFRAAIVLDELIAACDGKTEIADNGPFQAKTIKKFPNATKKEASKSQVDAKPKDGSLNNVGIVPESVGGTEQQKNSVAVDAAIVVAKAHLRGLMEGDGEKLANTYADKVVLMPGHEFLKPEYGFGESRNRSVAATVPREKLIQAMKKMNEKRTERSKKKIDEALKLFKISELEMNPKKNATAPSDPVGTPDGRLNFKIKSGDVMLKAGPETGDSFVFQLRDIDGKWKVVAEYID